MMDSAEVVRKFYTAFQNRDFRAMQLLYDDEAKFSDEVFVNLDTAQVRAMWEMLIRRGKDLRIDFEIVSSAADTVNAKWTAYYSFSKSGNKVVNSIVARFHVKNGKITEHVDSFDFYKWASQALGVTGRLLGWTAWMKRKVQSGARQSLVAFMNEQRA